jgi:uncharacterized protein (DUF58 family)
MRGIAPELAEYRRYRQGDDPRRLDWRVLARTDRAFLRLSTDRAILPTTLVVDASASMAFPPDTLGKWTCARRIAVALAAVAHEAHDPVGLIVASGSSVRRLAPRSRRGVISEVARTLDATRPDGTPPLAESARAAGRGRLVLLTDLLGEADGLLAAAREHLAAGGEVHVVHVLAREELDPPTRAITAVDPEDDGIARTLVPETRAEYLAAFGEWRQSIAREWRAVEAGYTAVVTDEPIARAVRRIVLPAARAEGAGA